MAALDLTEIPPAQAGAKRDQFELFARDFLVSEGFRVVEEPDRGADGGRDIIVEEDRSGPGGANVIRWLVSCKHKAHSGNSVSPGDELDVRDRLATHGCNGFIAFYSTLPSTGLGTKLNALRPQFEYLQLDAEAIERKLLDSPRGRTLAARYMPKSFTRWFSASQSAAASAATPDPQKSFNKYFLRTPHDELSTALEEAGLRDAPIFAVIYDADHPTQSKLDYALGYFMEYQTTKRLVDHHFVPLVGASELPELATLVPPDDPLENCLWVVISPSGTILRREGVYANPDVGLQRVREVVAQLG